MEPHEEWGNGSFLVEMIVDDGKKHSLRKKIVDGVVVGGEEFDGESNRVVPQRSQSRFRRICWRIFA